MKNSKTIIGILVPLVILFLPSELLGIEGITLIEKRVIALFIFAALFWILEPIPIYATSVMIIVLELILISDKGLKPLISGNPDELGSLLNYKIILGTFASPIIMLFLGGFFLAMAATKYRLDQNLARIMLKPFGTNPKMVMLGLMIITALFSMFMSNTATTAMMLSILAPVLALFTPTDKGRIAFALAIPVAANIGGIGTPIGTPPNAIALKYLTDSNTISFGNWMAFGVPFVIVMLGVGWIVLTMLYKFESETLILDIKGKFLKNSKANLVYITFAATILLWLTDFLHGMNSYVVAMIPVGIFTATKIITKEDLKNISWDVLWLVSGGIALGLALDKSGLAIRLVNTIPFGNFSPYVIIIAAATLTLLMANFMSHTATANLLMPIIAALGTSVASIENMGGISTILVATAIAASMGMALPISTPPNALAHGTGFVETKDMARVGVIIAAIGLVVAIITALIAKNLGLI